MLLYKYMGFEAARKLLASKRIQFSRCEWFNDPFDQPTYPRPSTRNALASIDKMGKEWSWRQNTGLLCLTRTAVNPLMWAHYAESHTGIVIGIDAKKAGFTDLSSNLIPAQFGSVVYVSERPNWNFLTKTVSGLAIGSTHEFPPEHFEKLQRLFLTKAMHWAYEEEVRVAKCAPNHLKAGDQQTDSGSWAIVQDGTRSRHLYHLVESSIAEVHFGFRAAPEASDRFRYEFQRDMPEISWFECALGKDSYTVISTPHSPVSETVDS
jgi:hypothetical protein